MIGIQTYDIDAIAKSLPQIGLGRHKVIFNPPRLDGVNVLVQVGGQGVRTNHCYIQREGSIPVIQALDPRTCLAEPINKFWINIALQKAKYIDLSGDYEEHLTIKIRPTLQEALDYLNCYSGPISIDIETDRDSNEILAIAISYKDRGVLSSMSIPFDAEGQPYWSEADELLIWQNLSDLLISQNPKIFQNFIFDTMYLRKYGLETRGPIIDTMILAHWINPELPKSLADLGRLYLTCDVWKGRDSWASNQSLWEYNAKDAGYTYLIFEAQKEKIKNDKILEYFSALSHEVLAICTRGWRLDVAAIGEMRSELSVSSQVLRSSLGNIAADLLPPKDSYTLRKGKPKPGITYYQREGSRDEYRYKQQTLPEGLLKLSEIGGAFEKKTKTQDFNPLSPKHVASILKAHGIKVPISRVSGNETTGEESLLRLLESNKLTPETGEFIEKTLELRGIEKLVSTYCDVALDPDGLCYFTLNIVGTVTSRFSSKKTAWGTGFNSQNLPKRFRKVLVPHDAKHVILNMDIKQADPHMVAWMSGEENMLKILNDPKGDLHAHTASQIFGYDITSREGYKDSFERKLGKACNNGLNYGMRVNKFIETCRKQGLALDLQTAQKAYDGYFKAYPKIRAWQDSTRTQVIQTRTLTTPFGRIRHFYGHMNDKLFNDALAYIPPTTVSDAVNRIWLLLQERNPQIVLGQCHDSLTLEVPATKVDEVAQSLIECSKEITFELNGRVCCFPIDIEIGKNWGELRKWIPSKPTLT